MLLASGHQMRRYIGFWKCTFSPGGETTRDDGEATDTSIDGPGTQRRWEQHFDDYWNNFGPEWKTVAKDRPKLDAGLKEFTKIHEAQSRKIKDEDDVTRM